MERTPEVRVALPEDLPVLERELALATPSGHRDYLAQQNEGLITYLIAWLGPVPVGHGLLHWSGPRDAEVAKCVPGCPEIFNLGVRQPYRSRGIGGLLLRHLEGAAAKRRHTRVGLGVALTNHRARSLYERLGYSEADAPRYIDRWHWFDAAGNSHVEEDPCVFLVKGAAAA